VTEPLREYHRVWGCVGRFWSVNSPILWKGRSQYNEVRCLYVLCFSCERNFILVHICSSHL